MKARYWRSTIDWSFLGVLVLAGAIVMLLWPSPFVYPIRLFVTLVHELSHGFAAVATGGQIDSIAVFPDASGLARTRGGNFFIIASAGYLGSTLFGGGLLALAKRGTWSREILIAMAIALAVAVVLFIRNPFGAVATVALAGGFLALAVFGPRWLLRFALYLLATLNCLYAAADLTGVFYLSQRGAVTDATLMARATGLPAIFWAILWLGLGVLALALLGRRLVRR